MMNIGRHYNLCRANCHSLLGKIVMVLGLGALITAMLLYFFHGNFSFYRLAFHKRCCGDDKSRVVSSDGRFAFINFTETREALNVSSNANSKIIFLASNRPVNPKHFEVLSDDAPEKADDTYSVQQNKVTKLLYQRKSKLTNVINPLKQEIRKLVKSKKSGRRKRLKESRLEELGKSKNSKVLTASHSDNSEDEKRLQHINPHDFDYLLQSKRCSGNVLLLIYIYSSPINFDQRQIIRETWANTDLHPTNPVRRIFGLGKVTNSQLQDRLRRENTIHGDTVQEDFIDSYRNLTYKGLAGLKWVSTYCRQAKFFMKIDDDALVDTFRLIEYLIKSYKSGVGKKKYLMGLISPKVQVLRKRSKWAVRFDEFPEPYYPNYCRGVAYVMSTDVAAAFNNISYNVPYFWLEDVYLTGFLARELNIKHINESSLYMFGSTRFEFSFSKFHTGRYMFGYFVDYKAIRKGWRAIMESKWPLNSSK